MIFKKIREDIFFIGSPNFIDSYNFRDLLASHAMSASSYLYFIDWAKPRYGETM